jgi:hypothetical protein
LRDREHKFQAKKAYVTAMSMFKSEHIQIVKNKEANFVAKGGRVKYQYATLDNICKAAVPVMSKYGLSHNWITKQDPTSKEITVTCILTHSLGHSEEVTLSGQPDDTGTKNAIQSVGSTTQYLERYTFLAVTGLSVGEGDNDGNAGGESNTLTEEEIKEFKQRLNDCTTIDELEKVAAEAAGKCTALNDLKSYTDINKEYKAVKNLIQNPPKE